MADKENRPRPKFTIRPNRRDVRRTITPALDADHLHLGPEPSTSSVSPPRDTTNKELHFEPPLPQPPTPWVTPPDLEEPPVESTWRKATTLNPEPTTEYSEEFRIIPGEAYEPVPLYINRDVSWGLTPIDIPVRRHVRHYRSDVNDPRMHDLRVEVTPISTTSAIGSPATSEQLFGSPRRTNEATTPPSGPLEELIRLLDLTYGCPRPRPIRRQEARPQNPPAPSPSSDTSRLTDSLQALVQLAKLFAGPSQETAAAYRRFKRPPRPRPTIKCAAIRTLVE